MSASQTDGFTKDCIQLLTNFRENNGLDFSDFCEEWKSMNFHYIFCGFRNDVEMIYTINQYFMTLKEMFVNSQSLLEEVGIIFLIYAIYFKQPPKEYCKIRITIDEWKYFKDFYEKLHAHDEFNKIKLIFWTLLKAGAFVFVEAERKYTFDYFTRKEFDNETSKNNPYLFSNYYQREEAKLTNAETGIIPAIQLMEDAYNEMKDLLDHSDKTKKALPSTSIVSELCNGFKTIANIFGIEPLELETDKANSDSTDSDDLRQQVETSIKQKRSMIKRRAMTQNTSSATQKIKEDIETESDDDDDQRTVNYTNTSVKTGKTSLKISFSKIKPRRGRNTKSSCLKLLDGVEKVAADELQEQLKVDVAPVNAVVEKSLDIIL